MLSAPVAPPDWAPMSKMDRSLVAWSAEADDGAFLLALPRVAQVELPEGAYVAFVVHGSTELAALLDRVEVLTDMAMDGLLRRFRAHAASLRVDAELAVVTRRQLADALLLEGQMRYWRGRCALTAVGTLSVLRAVRLRSWEDCDTDTERLDVQNGLLLVAHLAALFEDHLLTLDDDGRIVIAARLDWRDHEALGISATVAVEGLTEAHRGYLIAHRQRFATRQNLPATCPSTINE